MRGSSIGLYKLTKRWTIRISCAGHYKIYGISPGKLGLYFDRTFKGILKDPDY